MAAISPTVGASRSASSERSRPRKGDRGESTSRLRSSTADSESSPTDTRDSSIRSGDACVATSGSTARTARSTPASTSIAAARGRRFRVSRSTSGDGAHVVAVESCEALRT